MSKAQVNWRKGSYSDVFRTAIIEPSPLKEGQQVRVIWGKNKIRILGSVRNLSVSRRTNSHLRGIKLWSRQARAKQKLVSLILFIPSIFSF